MGLDSSTEIIAHFIGIFEQFEAASRARQSYDEFRATRLSDPDLSPLKNIQVNVSSPYSDGGFRPDLPVSFTPSANGNVIYPATGLLVAPEGPSLQFPLTPFALEGAAQAALLTQTLEFVPRFFFPLPSQQAHLTVQQNWLTDNDVFSNVDLGVEFIDLADHEASLQNLVSIAEALSGVQFPAMAASEHALVDQAQAAATDFGSPPDTFAHDSIHVSTATGAALTAGALVTNGEDTDVAPELNDSLPVPFQPEDAPLEDPAPEQVAAPGGGEQDAAQSASGQSLTAEEATSTQADGHSLNTGGNLLVNEVLVSTNWLDAPVWLVSGDHIDLTSVSQVQVAFNQDSGLAADGPQTATQAVNHFDSQLSGQEAPTPVDLPEEYSDAPYINMHTIDGNLLNYTHVAQTNFVSDYDVISIEFSATSSEIEMGGNTTLNAADVLTLGFYYDVIIVGGSVIDMTTISQTNVLFDSDTVVSGSGDAQVGFAGAVVGGENLLWNSVSLTQTGIDTVHNGQEEDPDALDVESANEALIAGDVPLLLGEDGALSDHELVNVLYITGDVINATEISQTNVLGDADQIALMAETMLSELGEDISVTTGQNALINAVGIAHGGMDSDVHVAGEAYSDALLYQAEFIHENDGMSAPDLDALASEAVAFLTDDMTGNSEDGDLPNAAIAPDHSGSNSADVMHIT